MACELIEIRVTCPYCKDKMAKFVTGDTSKPNAHVFICESCGRIRDNLTYEGELINAGLISHRFILGREW